MSIGVSDVVVDLCIEFWYIWVRGAEEEWKASLSTIIRLVISVRLGIVYGGVYDFA